MDKRISYPNFIFLQERITLRIKRSCFTWMLAECPDLWSGDEGKLSTIKIFPYMEAPSFARRASLLLKGFKYCFKVIFTHFRSCGLNNLE